MKSHLVMAALATYSAGGKTRYGWCVLGWKHLLDH
jgi:hypothetical protein